MRTAGQKYYVQQNVFDLRVLSTLGLSESDLSAIAATEGVSAVMPVKYLDTEGRWSSSTDGAVLRVQQLPRWSRFLHTPIQADKLQGNSRNQRKQTRKPARLLHNFTPFPKLYPKRKGTDCCCLCAQNSNKDFTPRPASGLAAAGPD